MLLLGVGSLALAQGISLGLKGGVNMSNIVGSGYSGTKLNTGFSAGGYLTLSLLPSFAIQPEIYYTQKGWKESGTLFGSAYEGKSRLNYLEIPVLAKFSFGVLVKPYFVAGPAFATLLSAPAEVTIGGTTVTGDIDGVLKKSDLGLVLGAGVTTPIKLSLEARYTLGLSSIDDSGLDVTMKNSNISLLVGYSLF